MISSSPVYDVLTGKIEKRLHGHQACVRDVSWHPYDNIIMSTSVRLLRIPASVPDYGCFNVRVSLQWDGCLGEWTYQQEAENAESGSDWEDSDSDSDEDEDARRKRKNLKSKHARRAKKSRWNPLNVFRNMRRTVVID